ncbi:hypothetical protein CsSME_00030199 [Camellia sinensis var. sinensis]
MEKTSPILLLLLVSSLSLASSNSLQVTFVQCLSNHSIPQNQITAILYTPNNPSFPTILQSYIRNRRFNTSTTPKPLLIITALLDTHVQAAVLCSKTTKIQLKIRSGGHDFDGLSYVSTTPFIILDMFNLRSISINIITNTAWVDAGATLGELYFKIASLSKTRGFPAGVCPTVAAGGHFACGGYGNMLRKYGLSADNVIDARIVDVNGRVLDRKTMGEDLFWAVRGGGAASFAVVLSYKIRLVPVPETVTVFRVERTLEQNAIEIVNRWQLVAEKIDRNLFIRLRLSPSTTKQNNAKTIKASFVSLFLGDSQNLMDVMNKEFPELGLKKQDCIEMSWIQSVLYWANFNNNTSTLVLLNRITHLDSFQKRKSDYIQTPIPKHGLELIWKKLIELGETELVFNHYGGRMSEIPVAATPFPHRAGNIFKLQYSVNWKDEGVDAYNNYMSQIRELYSFMTPFVSKSPREAFLCYRDLDIGITHNGEGSYDEGKVYGLKYFKSNFDRLVKVKTMVDPENFFRNEQSIPTFPSMGRIIRGN